MLCYLHKFSFSILNFFINIFLIYVGLTCRIKKLCVNVITRAKQGINFGGVQNFVRLLLPTF